MNNRRNTFSRACRALLAVLCLWPGGWALAREETNRFPAEQFIKDHLTDSGFIDLATNDASSPATTNRTIRGGFLETLLTKKASEISHDGLRLANVVVEGPVDLSNVEVPVQAWFRCCRFKDNLNLSGAHFGHDLSFQGCLFDGEFRAIGLHLDGSLKFDTFPLMAWESGIKTAPPTEAQLVDYLQTNQPDQARPPDRTYLIRRGSQTQKWIIRDKRDFNGTNGWNNVFLVTTCDRTSFLVQQNYGNIPVSETNTVRNLTVGPITNSLKTAANSSLDLDDLRNQLAMVLHTNFPDVLREVLTANATNWMLSARWTLDTTNDPRFLPVVANWHRGGLVAFTRPTIFETNVILDSAVIAEKLDAGSVSENGVEFWRDLSAQNLKVDLDITLPDADFNGPVFFSNAQIGHDFYLIDTSFTSFSARGMNVGGSLIVDHAQFRGEADFKGASISKFFNAPYVRFERRCEFTGLNVDGSVDYQRAQFAGSVNFNLAHVKGNLEAKGATFDFIDRFPTLKTLQGNVAAVNLNFGNLHVDGNAVFENAIFAGPVSFQNAAFGNLNLERARFGSQADFAVVSVADDFDAPDVRFENPATSTEFRGLRVDGLMDVQRAQFAGPVNFILSHIKGNFLAQDAVFLDDHTLTQLQELTGNSFTFNADFGSMTVDGFAIFKNVRFTRSVSFRNATFANLYLDGTRWPDANVLARYADETPKSNELLRLEGMNFETIRDVASGDFTHTQVQLQESQTNLLAMFADYSPYSFDIYDKLERYFVREGAPDLADDVHIKSRIREGQDTEDWWPKAVNYFVRFTVLYGRWPWLAFVESVAVILTWMLFYQGFVMRKPESAAKKTKPPQNDSEPAGLGLALFFSLSTFLPIIDLGATDLLEPSHLRFRAAIRRAHRRVGRVGIFRQPPSRWVIGFVLKHSEEEMRYFIAAEEILGFILVPLWTMALTGLIK